MRSNRRNGKKTPPNLPLNNPNINEMFNSVLKNNNLNDLLKQMPNNPQLNKKQLEQMKLMMQQMGFEN